MCTPLSKHLGAHHIGDTKSEYQTLSYSYLKFALLLLVGHVGHQEVCKYLWNLHKMHLLHMCTLPFKHSEAQYMDDSYSD